MRRITAMAGSTLMLASLALAAAPALAAPGPGPGSAVPGRAAPSQDPPAWTAYLRAQRPLAAAGDQIIAVGRPGTGFGSVSLDVPHRTITVRWKGTVPLAASKVLARIRSRGIRVEVGAARYSRHELDSAARQIMQAGRLHWNGAHSTVVSAMIRADGNGLDVGVRLGPAMSLAHAQQSAATAFGPDVHVVQASRVTETTRTSDGVPHWGGALMIADVGGDGNTCSSGWPIQRRSDGRTFITTADHCDYTGSVSTVKTWWSFSHWRKTDSNGIWKFGDVWAQDQNDDTAFIRSFVLGTGQGRIYDGGVTDASQSSKGIAGAGSAQQYDISVCHSGGDSGIHCGLVVRSWGWDLLSSGYWSFEIIADAQGSPMPNGSGVAVCKGDSGSPVFTLAPNSRVTAVGTDSQGVGGSFPWNDNSGHRQTCFSTIGFTDVNNILNFYGANLVLG